jgi:ubiquinone/menaquinone biosynthesis C-methylase UbiE
MFDFMSDVVGLKILHPGGVESTRKLIELLGVTKNMKVLDIACGKGRTSVYLAKKYGCKVVGVDILEKSIEQAKAYSKRQGVDHLVSFRTADAMDLPFADGEFDATLAQAMLILVKDKVKVIREVVHVLKPGGRCGWLELSWKKQPTKEFLDSATREICAACIAKVETFQGWEERFRDGGVSELAVHPFSMKYRGMRGMLADEGAVNGFRVMAKYITRPGIRRRMVRLNRFFHSYPEYIGYGIYIGVK